MEVETYTLEEEIRRASQAEASGNMEDAFDGICRAFRLDPFNYELFYMLGLYYLHKNAAQALMCLRRARAFALISDAPDREDDIRIIDGAIAGIGNRPDAAINSMSVVIVSYNDREYMEECLEAVRSEMELMPGELEVVVVDNASTDGVTDYLRKQPDITLIENSTNMGFSAGCNIGYAACATGNDIFLLNNDAVLTPNALFFLRMALYDGRDVGAVSAVSNNATTQMAEFTGESTTLVVQNESAEQRFPYGRFLDRALRMNVPSRHPYEVRARLTGFAVLIKREAADSTLAEDVVGAGRVQLMDERFSPAYFEDDDLGMRLSRAGYRQLLCRNSFIYHYGGKGFSGHQDLMSRSRNTFIDKWGFDIWAYELPSPKPLLMIGDDRKKPIRVLEIGCGMGVTLSAIRYRYPYSYVAGTELYPDVAAMGRHLADIYVGDFMTMSLPFAKHSFDYIIVSELPVNSVDSLGSGSRDKALDVRLREYLRPDGIILYD